DVGSRESRVFHRQRRDCQLCDHELVLMSPRFATKAMRYRHVLGIASLSALVIATGCGESAELSSQTPSPSSPSGSPIASPEAEPTDTPPIAPIAPYDPAGPV